MVHLTTPTQCSGTSNPELKIKCAKESLEHELAYKYVNLSYYTAHLQHEMEQMWEEELFCE